MPRSPNLSALSASDRGRGPALRRDVRVFSSGLRDVRSVPVPRSTPISPPQVSYRRIPEPTVGRLPVYQRILEELLRSGTATVSSELLGSLARVNAAKVRKDLSLLGSFGTRGAGYDVAFLIEQINRELGLDHVWPMAIVGIGNLGRALARSEGFISHGFEVAALFDIDAKVIGDEIGGVTVRHVDDLPAIGAGHPLTIGVIATPPTAAQQVADLLVESGVRSLLNFAPKVLTVGPEILLRYVDLSIELQIMSFYQSKRSTEGDDVMPVIRSIGLTSANLD
ncbi:MAG: redox-sensing transcriptional repressor Rex [Acidimicrobiales bacterium]